MTRRTEPRRLTVTAAAAAVAVALTGCGTATAAPSSGTATLSATASATASTPAPTSAAGYAALWDSLPTAQWGGGDVSLSVGLADGRNVWLYGDTFSDHRFVHSTAIVQDGGALHVSRGGAQVLPNEPGGFFWINTARAAGPRTVHAVARAVEKTGDGPWDFADRGYSRTAALDVTAAGDVVFTGWVATTVSPEPDPGRFYDDGVMRSSRAYAPVWSSERRCGPRRFGPRTTPGCR